MSRWAAVLIAAIATALLAAVAYWTHQAKRNATISDLTIEAIYCDHKSLAYLEMANAYSVAVFDIEYEHKLPRSKRDGASLRIDSKAWEAKAESIRAKLNASYGVATPRISSQSLARAELYVQEKSRIEVVIEASKKAIAAKIQSRIVNRSTRAIQAGEPIDLPRFAAEELKNIDEVTAKKVEELIRLLDESQAKVKAVW